MKHYWKNILITLSILLIIILSYFYYYGSLSADSEPSTTIVKRIITNNPDLQVEKNQRISQSLNALNADIAVLKENSNDTLGDVIKDLQNF
ncbi:MAG: hypothetical protein Q7S37_03490 [bacterium]|nr:hypothetical protein [bacterium]